MAKTTPCILPGLVLALLVGCSSPPASPVIVRAHGSSETASAGQALTFEVEARDPQGSALAFSWAADSGTLGTSANTATSSHVTWTSPGCSNTGSTTLTATVTNAFNLPTARRFEVKGIPVCSEWSMTGSMTEPRALSGAALLPGGRVLVAGGTAPDLRDLATAEVYDPSTGHWSATGSMSLSRWKHTVTALPEGKVLAAGGNVGGYYNETAEVFDPAAGAWRMTGDMNSPRREHTSTALREGKILVAGGALDGTSELYDPVTETWAPVVTMSARRFEHTATLLDDGTVLVLGGWDFDDQHAVIGLATAEVYNPKSNTWRSVGSMSVPRYRHTATLLSKRRVLVSGGFMANESNAILATAEVYDSSTETWSTVSSMPSRRAGHTATLLISGKVLVSGGGAGYLPDPGIVGAVYDPEAGAWSPTGPMSTPRAGHTATLLWNGKVLVAGGSHGDYLTTAELYTP